jgi:hypothetical protein
MYTEPTDPNSRQINHDENLSDWSTAYHGANNPAAVRIFLASEYSGMSLFAGKRHVIIPLHILPAASLNYQLTRINSSSLTWSVFEHDVV